jgi:hypothetical protein
MTLRALAAFQAHFSADPEWELPEGASFARTLQRQLNERSLQAEEFDNWRDCGWCVPCTLNSTRLWVCFARYADGEPWQLTVEPIGFSGPIAWLLGRRRETYAPAVRQLAFEVDRVLKGHPAVAAVSWALTGDPRRKGVPDAASLPWPAYAVA